MVLRFRKFDDSTDCAGTQAMAGRVMRCNGVPNSDGVAVDFEAVGADAFGRECFGACGDVCGFHVVVCFPRDRMRGPRLG